VASLDLSLILHDGVFELIDGDGTQGFLEVHPKGIQKYSSSSYLISLHMSRKSLCVAHGSTRIP
jgi:hypothetical protein